MTMLPDLFGLRRQASSWRGHVDGLQDGMITGWVALDDPSAPAPQIGLFAGRRLLARVTADLWREDLLHAGIGTGHHGFALPFDPAAHEAARAGGGQLDLLLLSPRRGLLGTWHCPEDLLPPPPMPSLAQTLGDILAGLADLPPEKPATDPPPLAPHRAFFARHDPVHGDLLPPLVTPWLDYLRRRHRLEQEFPLDDPDTPARLLRWYLASCGPQRPDWRQPLSAAQITWLNGTDPGAKLPRAVMMFLSSPPPDDQSILDSIAFRWVTRQAPAMRVEDCLIPETIITRLSRPADHAAQDWPLSVFLARLRATTPMFASLDPTCTTDRRKITLAAMIMALDTPGILRFLPADSITRALAAPASTDSPLTRFADAIAPDTPRLTPALYAHALRFHGFKLETRRFLTRSDAGHRLEPAYPALPMSNPVPVQIIGPFRKSSGLGEATRATARALTAAGFALHCVDFDMDNPAPEDFDPRTTLAPLARARVNILHLNAETLPLAFASLPDVFLGAYNIAYMFWELDSPATCHHLAFTLIDEIWVASEHGRAACGTSDGPPIHVIGLPAPDLQPGASDVIRNEMHSALADRIHAAKGDFIALAAFDSFSFVQRKNPLGAIAAFQTAFPADPTVRLILKTHNRRRVGDPVQIAVWEQVDHLLAHDPRITLLDETLPRDELMQLVHGADVFLSLHRSEGWGFGMIEAMALGVPVLASGYSGNLAFCSEETAWLVPTDEVEVDPSDYIFVRKGQKWGEPDLAEAARLLRALRDNPDETTRRAARARLYLQRHFTPAAVGARMAARIRPYLGVKNLGAGSGKDEHLGVNHIRGGVMKDDRHPLIGKDHVLSHGEEMREHVIVV